jgi:CMP-N-acetylneuraminic acid synthetase
MNYLGVIPARGGSKGIPKKNLALCDGKALLSYTAEAALGCGKLTKIILSTDSEEIADAGRAMGLEVPFLRPADLSQDATPILPVLEHLIRQPAIAELKIDAVVLLQPTSPLRTARHLSEAISLFEARDADSLVSIQKVPHSFDYHSQLEMKDGFLTKLAVDQPAILRRQDKPVRYGRNGPAILISSRATLQSDQLCGPKLVGYEMSDLESIDVDGPRDLLLAELLLRARRENPSLFCPIDYGAGAFS